MYVDAAVVVISGTDLAFTNFRTTTTAATITTTTSASWAEEMGAIAVLW